MENFQYVRENMRRAAIRQKKNYDRTTRETTIPEGTFVWRWYPPLQNKDKLNPKYVGPYRVMQNLGRGTYLIQRDCRSKPITVHQDHLKRHNGPIDGRDWPEESNRGNRNRQEREENNETPFRQEDEDRDSADQSGDENPEISVEGVKGQNRLDQDRQGRSVRKKKPPAYLGDYIRQ